jgi:hypothetical protein
VKTKTRRFSVGDWVEVRSKEEILKTLDWNAQLDGMPFMPEMFAFCGRRFQVYKRAHKTCDTVFPVRGRRVDRAVHLQTRCDGQAHGGCHAGCLIFWKEAWLKPIGTDAQETGASLKPRPVEVRTGPPCAECTESDVWAGAQTSKSNGGTPAWVCQATRLPYATTDLAWWDLRQYSEDYWSGNVTLWQVLCGLFFSMYYSLSEAGIGLGPGMRWFYNKFNSLWQGTSFPRKTGCIPAGQPTPAASLDLQPGELVRVKRHEEILLTLNSDNLNRGLMFDAEMVPYCGGTYRVLRRVTRIVNEKTGEMQEMKTPCIILDTVVCQSRYSSCRLFCPRSIYIYWREIWLERVGPAISGARGSASTPEKQETNSSRASDQVGTLS